MKTFAQTIGIIAIFIAVAVTAMAAPDTVIIAGPAGSLESGDFAFWWTGKADLAYGTSGSPVSSLQSPVYIKGFYYRLDDEPWNWTRERVIAYYDVPDGSYRLEVKAVDSANAEDPSPATRSFTVRQSSAVEPDESPFIVQRNFQDQLDSGIISEGLRQQFRDNGRSLSQDAAVSTITGGSEWLITDGNREYQIREEGNKLNVYEDDRLFRLDSDFEDELDDNDVTQELQDEFEENDVSLSQDANIEKDGNEWLITDGDEIYTVKKEGSRLYVYQDELRFGIELVQYITVYLDIKVISEGLRQEFKNNGIILSYSAGVSVQDQGDRWLIADADNTYIVVKDGNELSVYESINDDPARAIPLTPGRAIKCMSQADSDDADGVDEDWFRIAAEDQSRQITVFFKRPDSVDSTTIRVYRYPDVRDGREIARFNAQYRAFFATGIVPGDYVVRVTPGINEKPSAAYFLTVTTDDLTPGIVWDTERNDESGSATESLSVFLSRNTPWMEMVGNKWSGSDSRDYFKVHMDISTPTRLSLNLTPPQSGSATVKLFPARFAGGEVGRFQVAPNSGPRWKLETGVELSDYILEVELPAQQDPDFPYFLTLQISDFPSGELWELEPNDSPDSANFLPAGVRLRAAKHHADTKDWFRLSVPDDGILNLTTSRILKSGAVNIYLFDPILLEPVGDPLDYEVQEARQVDYLNLDVLAGDYLMEVDMAGLTGDYWVTAQFVAAVEHDAPEDAVLAAGDVLSVRMVWEPGNSASFDIIGVLDLTPLLDAPVPMYDDGLHGDGKRDDGIYVGTYTVQGVPDYEEGEDYVKDAEVVIHLLDQAGNTADIPIAEEITVDISPPDTIPPEILEVSHDAVDIPLRVGDKLTVTIEGDAENTATFDIGELAKGLPAYDDGRHDDSQAHDGIYVGAYTVSAEDYATEAIITGHLTDKFSNAASLDAVIPVDIVGNRPAISSVEHDGRLTLGEGDVLTVTLIADPDGIASFDIEGLVSNIPMYDDGRHDDGDRGDGMYVGSYQVAEGDGVISASVTAHLLDRSGRKTSKTSPLEVSIDAIAPAAVTGLTVYDRPDDQGGFLNLNWGASTEMDFSHYNIYISESPIRVTSDELWAISITDSQQTSADLEVEDDLTDYFVAITAVDSMDNESMFGIGSTAGPVQAFDNLKPTPVTTVEAVDRDQDFGGVIILSWTDANQDKDFARYNIYQETGPILFTEGLTPVDNIADRYVTVVDIPVRSADDLPAVDYYFAVTAVDLSGNESELDELGRSVSGPVRAENNIGPEPAGPVKFLSGPVGTVHHNHAAFHLSRYPLTGSPASPLTGYYVRLDDANWQWTTDSSAIYHDLSPGSHTFSVRPGAEEAVVSRSFSVVPVATSEREPNDSRNEADTIRMGMIIKGDNSDGGDWFEIHIPAIGPGVVDVLFSRPDGVGSTQVVIYADQPFREVGRFDSVGGQPGHFALGVAQESDYFVHVDSADDDSQYNLVVTVDGMPSGFLWEIEDNDSAASATPLSVADDLSQTVEARGSSGGDQDHDWFRIHVPDASSAANPVWMDVSFHRPDSTVVTSVEIYSSFPIVESRQIGEFSVGAGFIPARTSDGHFSGVVERGGDYFIKLDNGDEPASSAYHFLLSLAEIPADEGTAWEMEPNNLMAQANPLPLGMKQSGNNWDGNEDDDWYKLSITAPRGFEDSLSKKGYAEESSPVGTLNLHFSRPSGIGASLVEVYNAASQVLGSFRVDVTSAQRDSINLNVDAGIYYVRVHPENENPSAEYDLIALLVESISLARLSADGQEIERDGRPLRAGDTIAIKLTWVPDGKATFDVGDIKKSIELRAEGGEPEGQQSGFPVLRFSGSYTVAEGDNEVNAPVTVHLEDQFGNTADVELNQVVSVDTEPPDIETISHDGITPLAAGAKLTVNMVGTPGGRARFDISGFKTGLDMYSMTTAYAGTDPPLVILNWNWRILGAGYESWIVVSGEVKNVSDSVRNRVKLVAAFYDADGAITGEYSAFTAPRDIPPGTVSSFKIHADYTGRESSAELRLVYGADEQAVGESAGEGFYTGVYRVGDDDNISAASIVCYLTDAAGNQSTAEAEDKVTFDTVPPVIVSLTHDADRVLVEGDILTVTLQAEPGGTATFDIGDFRKDIELKEESGEALSSTPGAFSSYVGTYRVRMGDEVSGALITGYFKDAAGNEDTSVAVRTVSINTSAPGISAVTHNAMSRPFIEGETLVVTANTVPGAVVTFDVKDLVSGKPMYDDGEHDDGASGDGVYKGSYVVRKGDNVANARVKVTAVNPNGKSVIRETLETVSVDTKPPAPVTGVSVMDRPDDEGGYVVLSWVPSDEEDFRHYNIYQSEQPIISRDDQALEKLEQKEEGSSIEIIVPPSVPGVPVSAYYFAVTAVDMATNESLIARESTDGPASGLDNLPPPPVETVSAYDRAYDNGKIITVVWSDPSPAVDFYRYHIYMDAAPITSVASLVPVDTGITDRNILTVDIAVPEDGADFFFAVTAVDASENESPITSSSVAGPISSQDNLGVAPDTLVKIVSGPVGEIHYDDVTFLWTRWFAGQESDLSGYYYKLDNGGWTWTSDTYRTYYDLKDGEHTFFVRADLGAEDTDPMPATRVFAVKRLILSEMEPDDSSERANWISKGMTMSGTNADDSDDDWYRFHVESDGLMTLHFNRMGGIGTTNVTVFRSLPPTQETSVGMLTTDLTGQRQSFSTGVELGDYFVLVDSHGEDPEAKYQISVTTSEVPDGVQWDTERNDLPGMAQLLRAMDQGLEVSGFGNKDGDVDWYRVQIPDLEAGKSVFMNLDFVRPRGAGTTEISIYPAFPHDLQASRIGLITLHPANRQRQQLSMPISSSDCFLRVDNSQETDMSSIYSFRISFTPASENWEVEPNGVLQLANLLRIDEVMKGTSWHPNDDVDWYRVRLDRRGILVLSYFKPFGAGSADIKLKGANAADIASASAHVLTGQKATVSASLSLGDYLVSVDPENEEDASAEYQLVATVLDSVEVRTTRKPEDHLVSFPEPLSAGDTIELTVVWRPEGISPGAPASVSFDIGELRTALPMYDDGAHDDAGADDGVYAGTYTVETGDDVTGAEITLHLDMPPAKEGSEEGSSVLTWTADVTLEDQVNIDTTPPDIFKVDHNLRLRPLSEGEELNVTMMGEAGGEDAFFDIVLPTGVISTPRYAEIPMSEGSDGSYSGSYTVEVGDDLEAASVICHLIDAAGNESLKSAERPVSFDTTRPEIITIDHDAEEILVEGDVLTVEVASDTANGKGTFSIEGLVTDRSLYNDGTHGDSAAGDGVYTGQYTVRKGDNVSDASILARLIDEAGNVSEDRAFDPVSIDTTPPELASFVHDASDILSEDDMLTVTLTGDPENAALFDIEGFRAGLPMYDDGTRFDETAGDGVYVGTYTVEKGDSAKGARIIGYLTDENGNQAVYRIFERVDIDAVAPQPIEGVRAVDKADDEGFWIVLTWEASTDEDFDHYNIYREAAPITSVLGLTPLAEGDAVGDQESKEVMVPTNGVDYYFAVTASDEAGNESLLDREDGVAGPVKALDNLSPEPVTVVSAADRPDDQGKTIIVSWTKTSTSGDFDHYGVYLSSDPVASLEGLEPVLRPELNDTILIAGDGVGVKRRGVYVPVSSDGVDFYFAVTAFDDNGNESPLDSAGGSVTGPVRSSDDVPPQPVIIMGVADTPNDDGGSLDVQWLSDTDEEIREYMFYLWDQPIDDDTIQSLEPVDVVDASRIGVWNSVQAFTRDLKETVETEALTSVMFYELRLPVDLFSFYVAITAVDFGGNMSALDKSGRSVAGPVQSVSNTIEAGSDTSIFAGFDPDTWAFIPAGAMRAGETVDILWPDESIQQKIDEANMFLDRSHIDQQVDFHFADTVREFRASTVNTLRPVRITLSYPDVSTMQSRSLVGADLVFDLSQDDERQFRVFRLNEKSRIPRWDLVSGTQEVDTERNTVSAQIRAFGVFRVARIKLPENLDALVVYPNPFIPSQSISGRITFKNLTENATIQIYNMVGERMRTIRNTSGGDEAVWDVRNEEGEEVASGTYVFVVQSDEDTFVGKLIVLR